MITLTLFLAVGIALIHIFGGKFTFLDTIPRSRFLSIAGGISIAYVFLHLLPELNEHQKNIEQDATVQIVGFIENHAYIAALVGLLVFYSLERMAKRSKSGSVEKVDAKVFWLHIASFFIYNMLIGYLLIHRNENNYVSLILYFISMGLHFVVNDFGLRKEYKDLYTHAGRWILAISVLLGWAASFFIDIPDTAIGLLFGFLAGGIVLNVLKEELPEERNSRLMPFLLGGVLYSVLLLFVGSR